MIPLQLVKPKKCFKCNGVFTDEHAHRNYEMTHDAKPNECSICGKNFPDQISLGHHQVRVHNGHRNFKCDVCGKAFKLQSHLTVHKKKHEPSFKCDFCNEIFCFKYSLEIHNNLAHTWKKPLKRIKSQR